jgi:hypothetical protein
MPISEERKKIYKKLRKLGFHTISDKRSLSLHRWRNAKLKKKELDKEKTIIHDVINIHLDKSDDIYLVIYSEYINIILKHNQIFDINNFELANYKWSSSKKAITLNRKEVELLENLYHEVMFENDLIPRNIFTCTGCIHNGQWEEELELGISCPCTYCSRKYKIDNYEAES